MIPNNLFLNRLIVKTYEGKTAYDEFFHRGVNIIRGHNSSGKSTIIRFIFFVLGGCYSDFVPQALKCQMVIAEVEINGRLYTLKRYLEKTDGGNKVNKLAPMYIYFGGIEEYLADSRPKRDKWQKYGYKTTTEHRSFSNVLFELMGLPEFRAESNITMHQILRLIYLDQESPLSSIFFFDQWDKEIYRETVARLLMGLYDADLSNAKLDKIAVEKEIDEVQHSIKVAAEILKRPDSMSSSFLRSKIENLSKEVDDIIESVRRLREGDVVKKLQSREYQRYQEEIERQRKECGKIERQTQQLKAEIQDSNYFIDALKKKREALSHSIAAREYFDVLHLDLCPVCLNELHQHSDPNHCPVCNSPIDNTKGKTQAMRIQLDLGHQISESEALLKENMEELEEKQIQLRAQKRALAAAQKRYDNAVSNVRSTRDEQIDRLLQDKGYKEAEANQYRTLLEYAERYENLTHKLWELETINDNLARYIKAAEARIEHDEAIINRSISENGVYLLNNDEVRQDEFVHANDFKVNYKQNQAFISNQQIKLSASSSFYLKMAARFALLFASLQIPSMKYPRFMFSDNMEDKGMEEDRARNFQRTVVARLAQIANPDYQLIFATSNIAEEFDTDEYTIGENYTPDNKSLKNV